jgi:alkanesulfonate monooxygenase SsuD/methylene tetrahydromethanopterin reductase-like flavin-dependent oxidoreductase (luciferase family)
MTTDTGLALRSTVFSPDLVLRVAKEVDGSFQSLWFPAVSAIDPFDLCTVSLGATKNLKAGTGVIRLHEFELDRLAKRVGDLSRASRNRFVLGVGTGSLTGEKAIDQLRDLTRKLWSTHPDMFDVPIYFAALGPRMVRAAFQDADGVLLNFCSPRYASSVVHSQSAPGKAGFRVACYVKLFFAAADGDASRMLADEFIHYDALPQYHRMFEAMGMTGIIQSLRDQSQVLEKQLTGPISQISLSNPDRGEVLELLARFREAGVDIPVIYPYVKGSDDYKLHLVQKLRDWLN